MELTKSQDKAIGELLTEYLEGNRSIVDFSAPTGSGKTFMAAQFISQVFAASKNDPDKNDKTMVVVATVSNAELPKAFANKLNEYKKYLPEKNFDVEFRESPSNAKNVKIEHIKGFNLESNKVLVFGTSSFGKKKLFTEMGLLQNFIDEARAKKWNIIYIRDEAHKGGAKNKETSEVFYKRFDDQMVSFASFTIQMTATPKGHNDLIELKEEDLEQDGGMTLLKTKDVYNEFQRDTSTSDEVINEAIKKFKEIQDQYKKLPIKNFIRPALLIQVDSKDKNVTQEEYDLTIDKIIRLVDKEHKLKYLKYFSNDIDGNAKEDKTLESASRNDSNYDVVIFKVGPATGWDIPRACMLLQIREVSSESLNIQTVGRIKRNPMPGLVKNPITDKYYVYTNYQEGKRKLASYKLKEKFHDLKLNQGLLFLDEGSIKILEEDYKERILSFFSSSAIDDFIYENSRKDKLPIARKQFKNKNATDNEYYIYANSIFRLKIYINDIMTKNNKFFTDDVREFIKRKSIHLSVSEEIVKFTIINQFLEDIKLLYSKSYSLQRDNEQYKIIPNVSIKKDYQMWKSKNPNNEFDITNISAYGYTLIRSINAKNEKDIQYLDSEPETYFMKEVMKEVKAENYFTDIRFFAKMPTLTSEVFYEYFKMDDSEKHKAFIDFAIVSKDKVLMIEVKGWNDYDENKTADLLYAFDKYNKTQEKSKIQLMLCYAGEFNGVVKDPQIKFFNDKGELKGIDIRHMFRKFFNKKMVDI